MTDRTFAETGTILMACSVCGIGIAHLVLPGLRPILAPIPPDSFWIFAGPVVGVILIIAALLLTAKSTRLFTSVLLASAFLLFLIFGHLPNRFRYHPEIPAYWTDALKLLSMIGGMMTIAACSKEWRAPIEKWLSTGKYLFALMLVVFGIDHFLYVDPIYRMVPSFFGFPKAWTYFTGVALFAAGLAIFINVLYKLAARMLSLMLMSWLIMIHLPDTLNNPIGDGGILIGLLTCIFFVGFALVLGWGNCVNHRQEKKL